MNKNAIAESFPASGKSRKYTSTSDEWVQRRDAATEGEEPTQSLVYRSLVRGRRLLQASGPQSDNAADSLACPDRYSDCFIEHGSIMIDRNRTYVIL